MVRTLILSLFIALFTWIPFVGAIELPTPTSYVTDLGEMFTNDAELEAKLATLSDAGVFQVAVVTLPKLPEEETIEDAALTIFNTWGIGGKKNDTGVLILISRDDRQFRMETGYGVEGIIPDSTAKKLIDLMKPNFRNGDFNGGIMATVDATLATLAGDTTYTAEEEVSTSASSSSGMGDGGFAVLFYGIMAILGLVSAYLARTKEIWPGGAIGAVTGLFGSFLFNAPWGLVFLFAGMGFVWDWLVSNNTGGSGGSSGGGSSYKSSSSSSYRSSSSSSSSSSRSSFGGFRGGSSGGGGASSGW